MGRDEPSGPSHEQEGIAEVPFSELWLKQNYQEYSMTFLLFFRYSIQGGTSLKITLQIHSFTNLDFSTTCIFLRNLHLQEHSSGKCCWISWISFFHFLSVIDKFYLYFFAKEVFFTLPESRLNQALLSWSGIFGLCAKYR